MSGQSNYIQISKTNPTVLSLTNNPVNRIMVFKRDEGKSSLLVAVLFSHDVDGLNLPKLYEVVP